MRCGMSVSARPSPPPRKWTRRPWARSRRTSRAEGCGIPDQPRTVPMGMRRRAYTLIGGQFAWVVICAARCAVSRHAQPRPRPAAITAATPIASVISPRVHPLWEAPGQHPFATATGLGASHEAMRKQRREHGCSGMREESSSHLLIAYSSSAAPGRGPSGPDVPCACSVPRRCLVSSSTTTRFHRTDNSSPTSPRKPSLLRRHTQ
jgi:hypothetical protein